MTTRMVSGAQMGAQMQMFDPGAATHAPHEPQTLPGITVGPARSPRGGISFGRSRPSSSLASPQLKMFMSAREIKEGYQPLEGDRQEATRSVYGDVTPGRSSGKHYGWATYRGSEHPDAFGHQFFQRSRTGTDTVRFEIEAGETDEELWERKSEEAHQTPNERAWEMGDIAPTRYVNTAGRTTGRPGTDTNIGRSTWHEQNYTGSGTPATSQRVGWKEYEEHPEGGRSLAERLLDEGVKRPVSLGTGGALGTSGKPQVVGGHHRVAAMGERRPDELMPVLHFTSIHEARGKDPVTGAGRPMPWKYT